MLFPWHSKDGTILPVLYFPHELWQSSFGVFVNFDV